jgi:hypothetical protein
MPEVTGQPISGVQVLLLGDIKVQVVPQEQHQETAYIAVLVLLVI